MARADGGRGLRHLGQGLAVGAAAAALAAVLWMTGVLDGFEARTWDLRARMLARPGEATDRVVTILLDQYSLNWARAQGVGWPWPRSLYAMVADFCREGGARALVFDVLFTEETNADVGQDEALGAGIAANGRVVGAFNLAREGGQGSATSWPRGVPEPGVSVRGLDAWEPPGIAFPYAQFPIDAVAQAAASLANTNLPPDPVDGVYRRAPLFSTFDGRVVPAEALAAWLAANPGGGLSIARGRLTVGSTVVPIDDRGNAILRWRGPSLTHRHYTAAAVLNAAQQLLEGATPELDPAVVKDAYVFFGFTAPGLFDLKVTPMAGSYPGVEVNATALDNLLSGDYVRTVPAWAVIALVGLLALLAAWLVAAVSGAGRTALVYALTLPVAPGLGIGAAALGAWLPVAAPFVGVLVALAGSSLLSYSTEGRQKRYIKGAFRQYLSPLVIDELIAHPERLKLGGETRELTIFFSDIQGFTGISEALTAEALTSLLNEYLSAMGDVIQEEGGTIDKYIGDAIVAFWNAPLAQEDHAIRGTRALLRCQERLAAMRPSLAGRFGKEIHARIGLHTGPVKVGNMGSTTRFNYTILGDAANLASRLEGLNKYFRTYRMVSAAVVQRIGGAFPVRELSRVAVVGRREPVTVYEPMSAEEHAARRPVLEVFARGLAAFYEGRFAEARALFQEIAHEDPPAAAYVARCADLEASPPAGGWQGVLVMTEK